MIGTSAEADNLGAPSGGATPLVHGALVYWLPRRPVEAKKGDRNPHVPLIAVDQLVAYKRYDP